MRRCLGVPRGAQRAGVAPRSAHAAAAVPRLPQTHPTSLTPAFRPRRWLTQSAAARLDASAAADAAAAPEPPAVDPPPQPYTAESIPEGVTVVSTRAEAERVAAIVAKLPAATTYHAWDTEVADIDVKEQSPVGNGRVICASFYSGPNVDYGRGPRVWLDTSDPSAGVLDAFKGVLSSPEVLKVWHNYGFDRHVLYNAGIDVKGLGGDTMHMARLADTARERAGGYSLEGLSADYLRARKVPMSELFAKPKLKKDGTPGSLKVLPPVLAIQRDPDPAVRRSWVSYSVYDAVATWELREALEARLRGRYWGAGRSMWDFYTMYLVPFAECLTDMERAGIRVDVGTHLPAAERRALEDRDAAEKRFLSWAAKFCPEAERMNVGSDVQKAHFLFAPCKKVKGGGVGGGSGGASSSGGAGKGKAAGAGGSSSSAKAGSKTAASSGALGLQASAPVSSLFAAAGSALAASASAAKPAVSAASPFTLAPSWWLPPSLARAISASGVTRARPPSEGEDDEEAATAPGMPPGAGPLLGASASSAAAPSSSSSSSPRGAAKPAPARRPPPPAWTAARRGAQPPVVTTSGSSSSSGSGSSSDSDGRGLGAFGSRGLDAGSASGSDYDDDLMAALFSDDDGGVIEAAMEADRHRRSRAAAAAAAGSKGGKAKASSAAASPSSAAAAASGDAVVELLEVITPALVQARAASYEAGLAASAAAAGDSSAAAAASSATEPGGLARDAESWPPVRVFEIDNTEGYVEPGKKAPRKKRDLKLWGLGIPAVSRTVSGWPAASAAVLRALAGKVEGSSPVYGPAYDFFGGGDAGREACEALHALWSISAIDTMLSNFIIPLQVMADAQSRVHCSLNLNTETGRLSARRPNLQNQPALEKDRYGVRKAFGAAPGNKLVVADYGQLELRLLAHMAGCESMLRAFEAGGDFHSRTAMGMYAHVAKAVDDGEVLLEWDDDKDGPAPKPLLKNVFASERRKAKILNFSIAYGKTAMGLSRDWNVSLAEAKETVEKWYGDRPEVRAWQRRVLEEARRTGATRTLLGRYRDLPDITARDLRSRGHAERAAINTPIQGGAADVAMAAMLKLWRNPRLAALGWRLLLQIHDEVILEGPEESAEEALALVVADMRLPFDAPLKVELVVDAKVVDNWYQAK